MVPRLQPTPRTPIPGTRCSALLSSRQMPTFTNPSSASLTPDGQAPLIGKSDVTVTVSPLRILADTGSIRSGSRSAKFCLLAHSSTANFPETSVAVVITGRLPQISPILRARSLAPPRCPLRIGIANRPPSSTTTTAGSRALFLRCGATDRTAMPAAPTKISASASPKYRSVHSETFIPRSAVPPRASASSFASASPRSVKEIRRIFILTPPGTRC